VNMILLKSAAVAIAVVVLGAMATRLHTTETVQRGYQGVAMEQIETSTTLDDREAANKVPFSLPPASQDGQLAIDAYQNVQVLGHITSGEMTRLMTQMTLWVAPEQGCAYCHAPQKDEAGNVVKDEDGNPQADSNRLWADDLYTKRVARRMLQMTMHINQDWKQHVGGKGPQVTGVTCYTCHRGNPVPANIWFNEAPGDLSAYAGSRANQNAPAAVAALASLPSDALQTFLVRDEPIRVVSTAALPVDNRSSIKQTEWTYGLMMHMSSALGVNCTYCHNSRAFSQWPQSPPARATAWYGIRMVRDLNSQFLEPLTSTFPENRLGPTGDAPKVNCATCHNGVFKPLLGVSMLKDNMVLAEAKPQPVKTPKKVEYVKEVPGGFTVKGNPDGIESALIAFIEDGSKPVDKTTWFDFDRLLFKTGSAELDSDKSQEQLTNIAEILKAYPKVELKVGGYTDNVGNPAANKKLSTDRAKNVAASLTKLGIAAKRLEAEGYGSDNPVCAANDTDECRAQNRRISVRVKAK
jgi:photosynthetic reaction center cytochrome c subunit